MASSGVMESPLDFRALVKGTVRSPFCREQSSRSQRDIIVRVTMWKTLSGSLKHLFLIC